MDKNTAGPAVETLHEKEEEREKKAIGFTEENPAHFEIRPYIENEEEEEEAELLEPDHPLLEKFQKALKEHLLVQVEHLRSEIFELETGAKKKNDAREELGVESYEAQQLVMKQQNDIELCMQEFQSITSARELLEHEISTIKIRHKEKREILMQAQTSERHLTQEIEAMNLLVHQMSRWEHEIESDLNVSLRMFEKTKRDKVRLAEEKRRQDMFIYKLMTEVWRLEAELETMDMQLRVKEEEREKYAEAVANSNIDIDTFNAEYRCMLHSWNSVVIAISNRDKHYTGAKGELDELHENIRSVISETTQVTKLWNKELLRGESIGMMKSRVDADIENSSRLLAIETNKHHMLDREMDTTRKIIDQVEYDIQCVQSDNFRTRQELAAVTREYDANANRKVALDREILLKLEDQMTNDKAAKYLTKLVRESQEKTREMEITLANTENTNAKVLMDIEAQKCANEEIQRFLDELMKQQNVVDAECTEYESEIGKIKFLTNKKQRDIDLLNKKIDGILDRTGGVELSPQEVRIQALEKNIEDTQNRTKELEKFWLRQQGHIVSLSQQRQEQIQQLDLLRKQIMILEQRNLKIGDELDAHNILEERISRSIINFQNRLVVIHETVNKRKGDKLNLSKSNEIVQNAYIGQLKDAELELLKIQADIEEIEEDKVTLSDELIERNREALIWEKKLIMAKETKQNMDEERGEGGEVGNMRAEIHRMQVRFGQLKKAQDRMIEDLEHCISRRGAIVTGAEAREKRAMGGAARTRVNVNRKLDDLRNKMKQLEGEMEPASNKLQAVDEDEKRLRKEIEIVDKEIDAVRISVLELEFAIEQAKTARQLNLEILVLKQRRLQTYTDLAHKRTVPIFYRTESAMQNETEKQKDQNAKLLTVVENLMTDFPNHYHELNRISNTLKLPALQL